MATVSDYRGALDAIGQHQKDMAELLRLLGMLANAEQAEGGLELLAVTDREVPPQLAKQFPFPGVTRQIVRRSTAPPQNIIVPLAGALLYDSNENRLGGEITNTSAAGAANFVNLFLGVAMSQQPQVAPSLVGIGFVQIAPGATWKFNDPGILWCGSVWGVGGAGAGACTVSGVEF